MKYIATVLFSIAIFTAGAQTSCDSLTIQSIQYSPFSDSVIVVEVINASSELFNTPGFVIIDENGDTLAKETVNFFGIAGPSTHLLAVTPNLTDPTAIYTGELQLHTFFYNTLACTWPLSQSFCTPNNCADLVIGLQNWGGALVVGDFSWTVTDSLSNSVGSGTFTMVANVQHWNDTLCLPPGTYNYQLEALTTPSGGGPNLTASGSIYFTAPTISTYFDWYRSSSLEIPFYLHCATSTPNDILEIEAALPTVIIQDRTAQLSDGSKIQSVEIYSASGQLIQQLNPNATTAHISANLATGIYILSIKGEESKIIRHKMVIR